MKTATAGGDGDVDKNQGGVDEVEYAGDIDGEINGDDYEEGEVGVEMRGEGSGDGDGENGGVGDGEVVNNVASGQDEDGDRDDEGEQGQGVQEEGDGGASSDEDEGEWDDDEEEAEEDTAEGLANQIPPRVPGATIPALQTVTIETIKPTDLVPWLSNVVVEQINRGEWAEFRELVVVEYGKSSGRRNEKRTYAGQAFVDWLNKEVRMYEHS